MKGKISCCIIGSRAVDESLRWCNLLIFFPSFIHSSIHQNNDKFKIKSLVTV